MNTHPQNPYIGPRTFLREEGELFFGRDREGRDLGALIAAERLVVFYAQSGAGKSSIVNTRLIPDMENNRYEVLPVGRVGGDVPEGVNTDNVFLYNLMRSLVQHETNPNDIVGLSLLQFLNCLNADEKGYFYDNSPLPDPSILEGVTPWPRALIIDQFEELFSTHQEAWDKRKDFFVQLAEAIQNDPYLWVVLVMREDYIANLDPYAHLLPTRLRVRYYMQRLGREAALNAVKKPAEKAGRPFAEGVAEKLVDDLSSIKVQNVDGSMGMLPGQFVEAVQLQVVCFSLWENLSAGTEITEEDLKVIGNVDDALGKYYADRVAGVAKAKGIRERALREWIEKKLIAPGGIRNMVLQETGKTSGGIRDDVIRSLQSDLVRAENRGGAVWYELTHDRLVEPILDNNKKWFETNLSPLQKAAAVWDEHERNESWLLRDEALAEVEKWAKDNLDELTELESKFLAESQEHQAQIQSKLDQKARETRLLRIIATVITVLAIAAVVAAVFGFRQSRQARAAAADAIEKSNIAATAQANALDAQGIAEAERKKADQDRQAAELAANQALAGSLASEANLETNSNYPLALLMSVEAYQRDHTILTRTTLFDLLQTTPYKRNFDFDGAVTSVAVSPNGDWVAAASCNPSNLSAQCTKGGFKIFKAGNIDGEYKQPAGSTDFGIIYSMVFFENEGELVLATGGCVAQGCSEDRGQISLWRIADDGTPTLINVTIGTEHKGLVKTLAFSPERQLLASGSYDTFVLLWDLSDLSRPQLVGKLDHDSFVNSVAFDKAGTSLAAAGDDRIVYLWDISNIGENIGQKFPSNKYNEHDAPVTSVSFSPKDNLLASASDDRTVLLWNFDPSSRSLAANPVRLEGHTGYIKSVTFNGNGNVLASAGFDNKIILWDTSETGRVEQIGPALNLHSEAINAIAFVNDVQTGGGTPFLLSASNDRSVVQWDLTARKPLSQTFQWGASALPGTDSSLTATIINGQEISLNNKSDDDLFLVITGFTSRVSVVGIDASNLITAEQGQANNSSPTGQAIAPDDHDWVTAWIIDPDQWVTLACEAVREAWTAEQIAKYRTDDPRLENACAP